jgi:hypothetical protein
LTSKNTVSPIDAPDVMTESLSWSSSVASWLSGVESGSGAPDALTSAVFTIVPGAVTRAVMVSVSVPPEAMAGMDHTPVPGT